MFQPKCCQNGDFFARSASKWCPSQSKWSKMVTFSFKIAIFFVRNFILTPFLCFWIICTYVSINIFTNLSKERVPKYGEVILISCLTAFLLSIRITGILIFLQYFSQLLMRVFVRNLYLLFHLMKVQFQEM